MKPWRVPKVWRGRTMAVLAPGPSLPATIASLPLGMPCLAVGDAYRLAPWAPWLYHADRAWWQHHAAAVANLPAIKIGCDPRCKQLDAVLTLSARTVGFDPDPAKVVSGHNSGYQALHIAMHSGAKTILLLGFDMRGTHFFGRHPDSLRTTTPEAFATFRAAFEHLVEPAEDRGISIVNCTPSSALDAFPRSTLEAECAGLRRPA